MDQEPGKKVLRPGSCIAAPDTYDRLKAYFSSIGERMPAHYARAEPPREKIKLVTKRLLSPEELKARQVAGQRQRQMNYERRKALLDSAVKRERTKVSRAW